MAQKMKAAIFIEPERIVLSEKLVPDVRPLVTHRFSLDDIEPAYDLFGHQRDGVFKAAIHP